MKCWLAATAMLLVAGGAPLRGRPDLDATLDDFLGQLYDRFRGGRADGADIYDQMQGDQPEGNWAKFLSVNFTGQNVSDYIRTSRDRHQQEGDLFNRDKDNWIQALKDNILRQIGRSNMTTVKIDDSRMTPLNFTQIIPTLFNSTSIADVTEKIRSYYPSCDTPSNMDQEVWQSDKVMNLFFNNFDRISEGKGFNIATATLRLYRIPSENSTKTAGASADCDGGASVEEDKLLRVSIYWYTKPARKKQVKRRLSDSKVIQENARWVELSVKPATRAWSRGHNLGLAVQVEDQEGNILKADRLFKGALCMVGAYICTLEFPDNNPRPAHIGNLRINACNLKRSYEHAQMLAERDKLERLATLPELLSNNRHIRHQRQHLKHADFDPRSKIVNKRILTSEEVQALNLNITTVDR